MRDVRRSRSARMHLENRPEPLRQGAAAGGDEGRSSARRPPLIGRDVLLGGGPARRTVGGPGSRTYQLSGVGLAPATRRAAPRERRLRGTATRR